MKNEKQKFFVLDHGDTMTASQRLATIVRSSEHNAPASCLFVS